MSTDGANSLVASLTLLVACLWLLLKNWELNNAHSSYHDVAREAVFQSVPASAHYDQIYEWPICYLLNLKRPGKNSICLRHQHLVLYRVSIYNSFSCVLVLYTNFVVLYKLLFFYSSLTYLWHNLNTTVILSILKKKNYFLACRT